MSYIDRDEVLRVFDDALKRSPKFSNSGDAHSWLLDVRDLILALPEAKQEPCGACGALICGGWQDAAPTSDREDAEIVRQLREAVTGPHPEPPEWVRFYEDYYTGCAEYRNAIVMPILGAARKREGS